MQGAGRVGGRMRAFTSEDAEARVARHVKGLGVVLSRPEALARALRAVRKAAVRGGPGYDPAYHAALLRLERAGRTRNGSMAARADPSAAGARPFRAPGTVQDDGAPRLSPSGRPSGHRPSNRAVER